MSEKKKNKQPAYREAVREIETLLTEIEEDETDIDQLSGKVKRVAYLIELCRSKLTKTEKEVEQILSEKIADDE